jgi:hypothetical protein
MVLLEQFLKQKKVFNNLVTKKIMSKQAWMKKLLIKNEIDIWKN